MTMSIDAGIEREAARELAEWIGATQTEATKAMLRALATERTGWSYVHDAGGGSFVRRRDGLHIRARDFYERAYA
jgi:6-phosphogluconate dehydrogenase (decarboxylating)